MNEIWKDIDGFEEYQVSNTGKIKSLKWGKEKIKKPSVDKDGYFRICLSKAGKQKLFLVSRLIAIAFLPNPDNKPEINHKDGKKQNNHVNNLEWATRSENVKHSFDVLHRKGGGWRGGVNIYTKDNIFITRVDDTNAAAEWVLNNTSREYIWESNICAACNGRHKTAYGFIFKYNT